VGFNYLYSGDKYIIEYFQSSWYWTLKKEKKNPPAKNGGPLIVIGLSRYLKEQMA